MKREFKAGDVIFHYDYLNDDLHGFGKVLREAVVEYNDDMMLVEVNRSGENETTSDRVYKISEQLQCCRCGCVVVDEHYTNTDYPYYCPDCQENKYRIDVTQVDDDDWDECLKDSIGRFLPEDEY